MKKLLLAAFLVLCAAPAAAQTTVAVPRQPGGPCQGYSFRMESSSIFGAHDYPQITAVRPGSPAEAAGLRVGDLLVKRDGRDLLAEGPPPATRLAPGDTVVLLVRRDGRDETLRMVAGEIVAGPNNTFTCRLWTSQPASEKRQGAMLDAARFASASRSFAQAPMRLDAARRSGLRYPLIGAALGVVAGIGVGAYFHSDIEPGTGLAGPPAYFMTVPLGAIGGAVLGAVANIIHSPSRD